LAAADLAAAVPRPAVEAVGTANADGTNAVGNPTWEALIRGSLAQFTPPMSPIFCSFWSLDASAESMDETTRERRSAGAAL
jgi:hypothetical protein